MLNFNLRADFINAALYAELPNPAEDADICVPFAMNTIDTSSAAAIGALVPGGDLCSSGGGSGGSGGGPCRTSDSGGHAGQCRSGLDMALPRPGGSAPPPGLPANVSDVADCPKTEFSHIGHKLEEDLL